MSSIHPFANESEVVTFDSLTIENRTDRVTIYGNIDVTRDKAGLASARQLRQILDDVVRTLEAEQNLPDQIAPPKATKTVKNPFA
jgi:hypothetical protein